MKNHIEISNEIKSFDKKINVEGDKSLSIRFLLLAAQAQGISNAKNLLNSEDVNSSINCLKLMGIKISKTKTKIFVKGNGLGGFQFKKGIILNAGNSGTLASHK